MRNLKELIFEDRFGYTWQNAFICAIKCIDDDKKAKDIMKKWFDNKESTWPLYVFLNRIDHEPKSEKIDDLYDAIMSINMDDKYNLK